MNTTSKLFFSCLFCLSLILLSGCGNRNSQSETSVALSPADQAKIDAFIEQTKMPPVLTSIEQREADQYIERYKQAMIPHYLNDYFTKEEMRKNTDAERVFEYLKYFVLQGANVNAQDSEGLTAFQWLLNRMELAILWDDGFTDEINIAKFLVSQGADVNTKTADGVTLLHLLVAVGNVDGIKFLISQGADVNAKDNNGNTSLQIVILQNNTELAKFLVSQGANVNMKIDEGLTLLHILSAIGNVDGIKFLISEGADVNAKDNNGNTPLHIATVHGNVEVAKFLVSQRADVNVKNNNGDTPSRAAERVAENSCSNNIKQIVWAIHNFHNVHNGLPPLYSVDANGNPLHSWRVLILPFIGEDELYKKIRLDEPWDSQHNSQFHNVHIPVYYCPSNSGIAGKINCSYSTIAGAAFRPALQEHGQTPRDTLSWWRDGTINQIVIVEVKQPFCWMDPTADVDLEELAKGINKPNGRVGSLHTHGGMNIGLGDGAVRFVEENIDSAILRALGDPTDGVSVSLP